MTSRKALTASKKAELCISVCPGLGIFLMTGLYSRTFKGLYIHLMILVLSNDLRSVQ